MSTMERKWPDYMDRSKNPRWRWRRTMLCGEVLPDDWTLYDGEGKQAARIRKEEGGPQNGRWHWAVQVGPDGQPRNGGTGYADSGREARKECEARVPGAVEALSNGKQEADRVAQLSLQAPQPEWTSIKRAEHKSSALIRCFALQLMLASNG